MINKLLIANRGEIARRIIRTCRELGIRTVAVYSDADSNALHVREADESVRIGPPPVAESYLQSAAIVAAAVSTGADAVHPGYGLLSENPEFAAACRAAGLCFVGPSTAAIAAMGDKVEARRSAGSVGVPTVPGSQTALASVREAAIFALSIGYPVMLKAAGGGGGIGMQEVRSETELVRAFASNSARATAYFGNGEMFMEKLLPAPRHVEIQVLFDEHGQGVFLWERECSVQRRHQKVLEEAPSVAVDDTLRRRMGEAAVTVARAIGYSNAGTVEFLLDAERNFYFLEMNTRLQVEHPVTEMITGLDLVACQLRIASGDPLWFSQADVRLQGHAIEVRLYAEDPVRMLPSPGVIGRLELPEGAGIRCDVGVESGSVVTPYYDPMIGKLIVHAADRPAAIARLQSALDECVIDGIRSNVPLLSRIIASPEFAAGETTTDLIDRLPTVAADRV